MSRDGLLPAWAGRIHPRFRTPHVTTILTGAGVALASGLSSLGTLGNLVNIGTLLAFVIVALGIIVMRRRDPDAPRPFRVPWVPFIPALSAVASVVLMASLPWESWERLIAWMGIGVALYFLYGARRSRLRHGPSATE